LATLSSDVASATDRGAAGTAFGPEVDHPVGLGDDVEVALDRADVEAYACRPSESEQTRPATRTETRPMDDSVTLKFGRFELQARHRRLLQDGDPVPVGTRAFDVLVALAERRDRVVTKAEPLDLVWPGLVVEENNLQVQISTLRKLLGAQAIATLPGRGYQFTAALSSGDETPSPFKQRLAAILAADVVAYSRLMAADESATVVALEAARAVFREQIESRQGRVIDMAGDSVLAVFETATSIEQYLRLAPNATIRNLRAQVPLQRDADYERFAQALRQAGMPE
jgi:DNA-binding winged helix-turn-helix (wHTH) protein